ncbi:stromal membrane-associated protein 2 [Aplochiton taeniatus]
MMTDKSVKDIDRYQAVLTSLLALEENKYCADCESKGPRWASWNLGIFICIRCAGIHRNLGVHISKVKSVNLDQWTQEQIQCVQEIGNAKARRLYEAFLPECFQRPETDQSAECFIRDKYDKKKYMDKVLDIQRLRKEKSCDNIPKEPVVFEKMKLKKDTDSQPKLSPKLPSQSFNDLLGLDSPAPIASLSNGCCIPEASRSPAVGNPALVRPSLDPFSSQPASASASSAKTTLPTAPSSLQPVFCSMPRGRVAASVPENLSLFLDSAPKKEERTTNKLSKDSILSLYASAPSVSAHAGLYRNQMGYPTPAYGSYHNLAGHAAGMAGGPAQIALGGQQQSPLVALQPNAMMGVPQSVLMGQHGGAMRPQGGMAPAGGVSPSPFGAGIPHGMMGQQQVGGVAAQPQQHVHGVQQAQQLQWNITQMTQHMAGMNFYGTSSMMGYSGQHMGGPAPQSSANVAHVWK